MKVNVIKAKDKWAQSCGSLDWYDHINGMSARDVEIEMEYVCEQVTDKMLEMLKECMSFLSIVQSPATPATLLNREIEQLIKEATEI